MRRTRIVATIGPACDDEATLLSLLQAGVNVCRLNYSHGAPEEKTPLYERIRSLEDTLGRPTCILADLPGPKLRLGRFPGVVVLERGASVNLHCGQHTMTHADIGNIPVEYEGLSAELNNGDPVLIADGLIRLKVVHSPRQASAVVECIVEDGGVLSERKGVNVCLLYTSPSPRDATLARMPSSA